MQRCPSKLPDSSAWMPVSGQVRPGLYPSLAGWVPPRKVRPLAITSMRRSSGRVECSMLSSVSKVLVVTRVPASRQILAAALSKGPARFLGNRDNSSAMFFTRTTLQTSAPMQKKKKILPPSMLRSAVPGVFDM